MEPFSESRPQSRFPIHITRRTQVYLTGALVGFIWILPVFGPPGNELGKQENGASALRFLRLIAPLFVVFLVRRQSYVEILSALLVRLPKGRISRSILLFVSTVLTLGIIPLLSGLLTINTLFLISAVFPLTLSLIALVGIILLDDETLKYWVMGVTAVTAAFLLLGMVTTHFESTMYWGRPRIVLGFIHPIYAASAILGTMVFLFLTFGAYVQRMQTLQIFIYITVYLVASMTLLFLAQDRNQLSMLCIDLVCFAMMRRANEKTRFLIFAFLLLVPVALYLFVIFGSNDNPLWASIDKLSSNRLSFFQLVLSTNFDISDPRILFEASGNRQAEFSELVGFAATDSVYLTFLINYGLFALLSFVGFLLYLGVRLAQKPQYVGALALLCGLVFLYGLDASGITTSNLVLFILLAYAVRTAVSPKGVLFRGQSAKT